VAGVAVLIGVADELSVQFLVTGESDASGFLVLILLRMYQFINKQKVSFLDKRDKLLQIWVEIH
jgi:hypothetical protein